MKFLIALFFMILMWSSYCDVGEAIYLIESEIPEVDENKKSSTKSG